MDTIPLAIALRDAMQRLQRAALNSGTAGNASVRTAAGFLITPSGVKPDRLESDGMVAMSAEGACLALGRHPSSEWRFHKDIYRARPETMAIVHVHSTYATALACQRRSIPAFHYMVATAGGRMIRCSRYATFGTQALSDAALEALAECNACLLANHGVISLGPSLEAAVDLAIEVESLARQYSLALTSGEPVLLSDDEMSEVLERFKNYGQS